MTSRPSSSPARRRASSRRGGRFRRVLTAMFFAAIGFGVATGADYLAEREPSPAVESALPTGITVAAKEIRTVPDVSAARRKETSSELRDVLRALYTRAFTRPPDATPEPTPTPTPARRVRDLMTKDAVAALKRSPDVFDIGELIVTDGTVTFSGVVTFGEKKPAQALLDVDFIGRATPTGRSSPVARVHQRGTVSLRHVSDGWRIDGFDLRFATRPAPTPMPTPAEV